MTVSELFRGLLTAFCFLFSDFSPCEVYIGILFYLRMARAVFEGTNMVNAKGSNGHF